MPEIRLPILGPTRNQQAVVIESAGDLVLSLRESHEPLDQFVLFQRPEMDLGMF